MRITGWLRTGLPVLVLLAAATTASAQDALPVPENGRDLVRLTDGRILAGNVDPEDDGFIALGLPHGRVRLPKDRIQWIRLWSDFDPEPRNDEERASAKAGLVRWKGEWVSRATVRTEQRREAKEELARWEADEAHLSWDNRWIKETRHFRLEANLRKEDVEWYADLLEAFYKYFTSAFKVSVKRRIPVYMFGTYDEFRAFFEKDTGGTSEHTVGYFVPEPGNERLVMFHHPVNRTETLDTLFHETVHLFVHLARPDVELPRMLDEGMAEYYGACRFVDGKIVRGGLQTSRLAELHGMVADGGLMRIESLLRDGHSDWKARGDNEYGLPHYAQGWLLVHYLIDGDGGKYRDRFAKHLNWWWKTGSRDAPEYAHPSRLFRAYDEDLATFAKNLKIADLGDLRKRLEEYLEEIDPGAAESGLAAAYRLCYQEKNPAAARQAVEKALAAGGDDRDVLYGALWIFAGLQDWERAGALRDRLLELHPLDVELRYELADLLGDEESERLHLGLCVDLDPDGLRGHDSLAWLIVTGQEWERFRPEDPDGAMAAAVKRERGIEAAERDADSHALEADLLLRLGRFDEAEKAVDAALAAEANHVGALGSRVRLLAVTGKAKEIRRAMERYRDAEAARLKSPADSGAVRFACSRLLLRTTGLCLASEAAPSAAASLDVWYRMTGIPGMTEGDWLLWVGAHAWSAKHDVAARLAGLGLKAHPWSVRFYRFIPREPGEAPPDDDGK